MSAACRSGDAGSMGGSLDESVTAQILGHANARGECTALVYPTRGGYSELTYRELRRRVIAIAAGLGARDVKAGDKVVLLVPMSPELYLTLLAIGTIGAVAVFVEPASTASEILRVIRTTRPRAFIGIARAHVLRLFDRRAAAVAVRILVGSPLAARLSGAEALSAVEVSGGLVTDHEFPVVPSTAPALLTFSSGSTGTPKGAVRSHGFLQEQHRSIERLVARPDGDHDVHLSAFAIVLLSSLCAGQTAVIPRMGRRGVNDINAAELTELIFRRKINVISGSPAFIDPLVERCRDTGQNLHHVRRVVTGGAPVSLRLCERADGPVFRRGALLVTYGSTEAEPIATIDATDVVIAARESAQSAGLLVGTPDAHLELRLLRPTNETIEVGPGGLREFEVARGAVGEVVVSGAHVNKHYFRNALAERENKIDDERGVRWHRTGDVARIDEHGRLWIVGRVADTVRRGDAIYHSATVEATAQAMPGVARAALIAGRDGKTVLVVEAVSKKHEPTIFKTIAHAMAAAHIVVDRVELSRKLPVDPRHKAKLDYPAIRRQYA